jgi:hypothetical protein
LAPTFPFNYSKEIARWLDPRENVIIDIGSGNRRIDRNIVCVDVFGYDEVDIVCDIMRLPFRNGSVDAFISRSVLEHVPKPEDVVRILTQKTRAGGLSLHLIPFMMPFHASPNDFKRFTHQGVRVLFEGWEVLEQFAATGPMTLFLLCAIEVLSILFSFGNRACKSYFYLAWCGLLFPLKYLDVLFVRNERFLTVSPTIFSVMRKP